MKIALHWKILIGLVAGTLWAILATSYGFVQFTLDWVNPFGNIFIKLLKLIAVPLVLFSIIKGITDLSDVKKLGRLGVKTLTIYLMTTLFAVSLGLALVNIIKPGKLKDQDVQMSNRIGYELWLKESGIPKTPDGIWYMEKAENADILANATRNYESVKQNSEVLNKTTKANATKEAGPLKFLEDMVPDNIFASLTATGLMLQIIVFAVFFGIALLMLSIEKTKPLILVIESINEVFLKMVDMVMNAAPFFVFALMAGKLSELTASSANGVDGLFDTLYLLGKYSLTVILGLVIMLIVYPSIVAFRISKMQGWSFGQAFSFFLKGIRPAQLLAFSTSSSAATLPITMDCVHENLGVKSEISSFVLPIGATVNMDGTSLYQAVAVVFLAQFHLVDLTLAQQVTIIMTATLASIGSAAIPSAGLIMLIIVLESVGLNPAWIAIILPIDRILDMCRTVVNVTGDAMVSTLIAGSEGKLEPIIRDENE